MNADTPRPAGEAMADPPLTVPIHELSSFLDSLIDNIPDMIFVKEAKELRFVRFNRAAEELLGYSRHELIGRNDYDFFTKEEADFFTSKDREVLESRRMHEVLEEPIHTKYKGTRLLHTKKIPIFDQAGVPQYLLGISEDVTDRRNLERELLAIHDRERRCISHDLHDGLGQLLAGIGFMSRALSDRLVATNHPAALEAERIVGLIGQAVVQTRDVARLLSPIDLQADGLKAALEDLALGAERMSHIPCRCVIDPSTRGVDGPLAYHLYRIAQECTNNALKHSRAKSVTISLSARDGGAVLLEVADDGIGMSEQALRSSPGLGLSIMQYRARMIGATLKVSSQHGSGTLVTCLTPPQSAE